LRKVSYETPENMSSFNLQQHEIAVEKIYRNLASSALAKEKTECDPVFGLDLSSNQIPKPSERDSGSPQCLVRQSRL
jgi:hypothetical protein